MKDREAKIRCGIFLVAGLLLLLALLFFLGGRDLFVRKATIRTSFSESVQGLSKGSAVKYHGAPVGTVSRIVILTGGEKSMIQVDMEIELEAFGGTEESFESFFRRELQKGLRCRMEFLGVTGLKYIDFDYFAKPGSELPEAPNFIGSQNAIYVPSVPSSFRDIYASLVAAMERISHIKFEEISEGIDRTLSEFSALLSDPAIRSAIARVNDAAANLEETTGAIARSLDEKHITRITGLLESNLARLEVIMEKITVESEKAKISESTASFRAAAAARSSRCSALSSLSFKTRSMVPER